jgi:hypothetical protein
VDRSPGEKALNRQDAKNDSRKKAQKAQVRDGKSIRPYLIDMILRVLCLFAACFLGDLATLGGLSFVLRNKASLDGDEVPFTVAISVDVNDVVIAGPFTASIKPFC